MNDDIKDLHDILVADTEAVHRVALALQSPSEAEVKALAAALEGVGGLATAGVISHDKWKEYATDILATGLHVCTAEERATLDALARLTPTVGHNVIFIDPGPRYRAVVYDPDGHWDESVWTDHPTIHAAILAALDTQP